MSPAKFKQQNVVYAESQKEYLPLPAHKVGDEQGTLICCWQLTWKERFKILFKGKIWHRILTFKQPLQPQLLGADSPFKE